MQSSVFKDLQDQPIPLTLRKYLHFNYQPLTTFGMLPTQGKKLIRWAEISTMNVPPTPKRGATEVPHVSEDWEPHKDLIMDLFYEKKTAIEDVVRLVQGQTGFTASPAQYRRALDRWGQKKYLKLTDTQRAQARIQRDDRVKKGKHKHAYKDPKTGIYFDSKKVERSLTRNSEKDKSQQISSAPISPNILVDTPESVFAASPITANTMAASPSGSRDLQHDAESMDVDQILDTPASPAPSVIPTPDGLELSLMEPNDLSPFSNRGWIDNVSGVFEISIETDGELYNNLLHTTSEDIMTSTRPEASRPFCLTYMGTGIETPQHSARNESLAPLPQHPDTNLALDSLSYGAYGFTAAVELPYWSLLDILAMRDMHNNNTIENILSSRGHNLLLEGLLGRSTKDLITDHNTELAQHFSKIVPQRHPGEVESKIKQLSDPSGRIDPLQHLFSIVAFYVSNNLLEESRVLNILKWIIEQRFVSQFNAFLRVGGTTAQTFFQNILHPLVSLGNSFQSGSAPPEYVELLRGIPYSSLSQEKLRKFLNEATRIKDETFVESLFTHVDTDSLAGEFGGQLLAQVASRNGLSLAKILLSKGADIEHESLVYQDRGTPLGHAVFNRHLGMVRLLLENGADTASPLFIRDDDRIYRKRKWSVLEVACRLRYSGDTYKMVGLLLAHGADINCSVDKDTLNFVSVNDKMVYQLLRLNLQQNKDFITTGDIVAAAKGGAAAFSKFLYRNEGKISENQIEEALEHAVMKVDATSIVTLLDSKVDPNGRTLRCAPLETALYLGLEGVSMQGIVSVVRLLINAGADVNIPGVLRLAIYDDEDSSIDRLACLKFLLDCGADVEIYGPEALMLASMTGNIEAIALLLSRGTPINTHASYGFDNLHLTPLQVAALTGNLQLTRYLVEEGADVHVPAYPYHGRTALQAACNSGNKEVVEFLLEKEADVNSIPAVVGGITCLQAVFAFSQERLSDSAACSELFKFLLQCGACPKQSGVKEDPVIHTLIRENMPDLVDAVLQAGIDPNLMSPGRQGRTPLQLAAERGHPAIAKLLIAHRGDINHPPAYQYGRTALQAAASLSPPNLELVKYLVDLGAEVNAKPAISGGITAMQAAAIAGCIPVAEFLLSHKAHINAPAAIKEGRTAIEGAAEHGRLDMVQWLINHGATGYKKAIELAEKEGRDNIIGILKSAEMNRQINEQVAELLVGDQQ